MVVLGIIDFAGEPFDTNSLIRNVAGALDGVKAPQHIVFGVKVQEKGIIQISSEWNDAQDDTNPTSTQDYSSFINRIRGSGSELQNVYHVTLNRTAFGTDGPATGNVVEYVLNYFPASRVTPEFQKQVEDDFLEFDEAYVKGVRVDTSVAYGWVLEEQSHEDVKGEKAKCFLVSRGWTSMDHFEQSVKTDAYKKAIPILLGWNAPWKMWHVEQKAI
ncbi:hypothetical protein TCE0_060r18696 [Talaromyces pinophilus]|uniref:ABM domain-containing protein n=1 Tax=Talaromyces pinophilus TaxID=128442 RepID=A0A6V8HP30_TALPI|nr:hypothetical protein DPV78_007837 [Talaromyces pinophilus]PCG88499.1 Hypothetical protein PENO1_109890 [Penicillium occitanis (nom. inval.)]PCG88627.1 hypothetical protein PENOC_110170 [Penicillium occitanis (nom. inval.)]GAM43685.1 hypothetical protein TCE0_060r18696 [Talaromyces pinophilus]